jgi:hypothetical protein
VFISYKFAIAAVPQTTLLCWMEYGMVMCGYGGAAKWSSTWEPKSSAKLR